MKILLLLLTFISFAFSEQYLFLVNKYDKEIELEAKIIAKIANSSLEEPIKLFIPNISLSEKEIYSKHFEVTQKCEEANFIFDKRSSSIPCDSSNKLCFTNNYKKLVADERYYGAFFWSKSRPNIVFVKNRLTKNDIQLSKEYAQFIEEF